MPVPLLPALVIAGAILVGAGALAARRDAAGRDARAVERINSDLARWRERLNRKDAPLLGEAVAFDLADAAAPVVERALAGAKGVRRIGPDRWLIAWARDDDLGVGWSRDRGGAGVLSVWWARESIGVLVGTPRWRRILRSVEREAAVAGVRPFRRRGRLAPTAATVDGDRLWIAGRDPSPSGAVEP